MTVKLAPFFPDGRVASAQGVDVSNFQGLYNWGQAKKAFPGLAFGIHRATQGLGGQGTNSPDPTMVWNHQQIRDNGLRRGAYHFGDPSLPAATQARYFVDTLDSVGLVKNDILSLDDETWPSGMSARQVSEWGQEFMSELVKLRPENPRTVYTFLNFARQGGCAGLEHYDAWLAYPASKAPIAPPPWANWRFWQWGIRNGVDCDAFNGTSTDLDIWIASFRKPPAPAGPPYPHVTKAGDTIVSLAISRNMSLRGFLSEQAKMLSPADQVKWSEVKLPAGLPWYTLNP